MSERKPIALFDMDGSLFDYHGQLLKDLEAMRSPYEPEDLGNIWDADDVPWLNARIKAIRARTGWWLNLPPLYEGFRIFNEAKDMGFDCRILTKGPKSAPHAWGEKVACCQNHLGRNIDVDVTSDKGGVYGKVLYDDFPDYMDKWLYYRPRGLGIMPVNDYNKDYTHPRVVRWDGTNIHEVVKRLHEAKMRFVGLAESQI